MRAWILGVVLGFALIGWANPVPFDQLPDDAVLVTVNDAAIKKSDFRRMEHVNASLYRNKNPSVNAGKISWFLQQRRPIILEKLVLRKLVETRCGSVSQEVSQAAIEKGFQTYYRTYRGPKQKLPEFKAALVKAGIYDSIVESIGQDAKFATYINTSCSNELKVSSAEIETFKQRAARLNAKASATNDATRAFALKIRNRIIAGESFQKLAKQYSHSDDKTAGGDMGICTEGDFQDESDSYREKVFSLKVGEVSELLETSEGYELVIRLPADEETSADEAHLARIFFRRVYQLPAMPDQEISRTIYSNKRENCVRREIIRLRKESIIKYPLGKSYFPQLKQDSIKKGSNNEK